MEYSIMAKANQKTENATKAEVAEVKQTTTALALADVDFAADAGAGMEGATAESFAIPFLSVLQKSSPQVDEADGAYIEGAKAGMFYENVTNGMHDGKTGILVVPCSYRRVFLRWGPRGGEGAGFKGEMLPEVVAQLRAEGKIVDLDGKLFFPLPDGSVNDKKCDRVADTRNHYVLLLDEKTGAWTQALVSLTSTQIKKSKMLMSAMASVKLSGPSGMYTPPTFANKVRVQSIPESNDKGTWHGVKFELAGRVDRAEVYAAAKAFHASVSAGSVEVKYEGAAESSEGAAGGF
jgi:hypothetical protein